MVLILHSRISQNTSTSDSALSGESESINTVGLIDALATSHSSYYPWNLPFRSDSFISQQPAIASSICDSTDNKQSGSKYLALETSNLSRSPIDQSSNSSFSVATLRSETSLSPDLDEEGSASVALAEIVPKVEDGEVATLAGLRRSDTSESPREIATDPSKRRKRGRPLKHSTPSGSLERLKTTGMRSKTGCLTCRKRKKKCDEAKPICMSCKKNAIFCEGYREIQFWKSGKDRLEQAEARMCSFPVPNYLPPIIEGVETEIDRQLFFHFYDLIGVYTLHDDYVNPFKDLLLPMATQSQHRGLLHSLMALSASHIIQQHFNPKFEQAQYHHCSSALAISNAAVGSALALGNDFVDDTTMVSTIIYLLISITDGSINGDYRVHLDEARRFSHKSQDPRFQQFISEFSLYHDVLNSLTSLDRRPLNFDADYERLLKSFESRDTQESLLVGVVHGLFRFLWRITNLRDTIRAGIKAGRDTAVRYDCLPEAITIDAGIRDWDHRQELNASQWLVAQIYRQFTWVYLYRTIKASKPDKKISSAVDDGLKYLRAISPKDSAQCILLAPVFILSCAAFEKSQRSELEETFQTLQDYSNLGNIKRARQVVGKVWELMDAGDETSWDWEVIMAGMNYDSLFT